MNNKIKELRVSNGVTQSALAKHLGIAQNTLSYWEQGKYDVDTESLKKIAEFFNCSVDCVLGLEDIKHQKIKSDFFADLLSDKEKQIIIAYRKNENMQSAIDKLLGIEEGQTIAEDMKNTIKQVSKVFSKDTVLK